MTDDDRKERRRKYYREHRDKLREYQIKYRARNPDKVAAWAEAYWRRRAAREGIKPNE